MASKRYVFSYRNKTAAEPFKTATLLYLKSTGTLATVQAGIDAALHAHNVSSVNSSLGHGDPSGISVPLEICEIQAQVGFTGIPETQFLRIMGALASKGVDALSDVLGHGPTVTALVPTAGPYQDLNGIAFAGVVEFRQVNIETFSG